MTNHPNRSRRTRRVYLLDGKNQIVHVMDIVPATYEHEIGTTWASGPNYNNRPAALNFLTDDLAALDAHIKSIGIGYKMRGVVLGRLEAASAGFAIGLDGDIEG